MSAEPERSRGFRRLQRPVVGVGRGLADLLAVALVTLGLVLVALAIAFLATLAV